MIQNNQDGVECVHACDQEPLFTQVRALCGDNPSNNIESQVLECLHLQDWLPLLVKVLPSSEISTKRKKKVSN
jgi:hypothetical protein